MGLAHLLIPHSKKLESRTASRDARVRGACWYRLTGHHFFAKGGVVAGLFLCQESCRKRGRGLSWGLVTRGRNTSNPSHFPAVFTQQSLGEW